LDLEHYAMFYGNKTDLLNIGADPRAADALISLGNKRDQLSRNPFDMTTNLREIKVRTDKDNNVLTLFVDRSRYIENSSAAPTLLEVKEFLTLPYLVLVKGWVRTYEINDRHAFEFHFVNGRRARASIFATLFALSLAAPAFLLFSPPILFALSKYAEISGKLKRKLRRHKMKKDKEREPWIDEL
jgi:hypothetical protein